MFLAALSRPCLSLKSAHLALPITVPPLTDNTKMKGFVVSQQD